MSKLTIDAMVADKDLFTKEVASIKAASGKLADRVQSVIIAGMLNYMKTHNSNYLADIMNSKPRGIALAKIQKYIQDFTDLQMAKLPNGEVVFQRSVRPGFEFVVPTVTWDEHSKIGDELPEFDVSKAVKQLLGRINNAVEGKKAHLKEGQEKQAQAAIKALSSFAA